MSKKHPEREFYRPLPAPDWFPRGEPEVETHPLTLRDILIDPEAAAPYFEPREMKTCPTCNGAGVIEA